MSKIHQGPPPKQGMQYTRSNNTALINAVGKVCLDCPVCGVSFLKPAAWAKRRKNSYCGRGCADEAKRRQVETHCTICSKPFLTIPSNLTRIVACSPECMSERRRRDHKPQATTKTRATGATSKLTAEQVAQLVLEPGVQRQIAARYGVSPSLVSRLKSTATSQGRQR